MRRMLVLFIVMAAVGVLSAGLASAAPAPKTDVCHFDADSGVFFKINISENAFDAHVAHGDAKPFENVPGVTGYAFDGECVPTAGVSYCNVDTAYDFIEAFGHASDNRIFYQGIMDFLYPWETMGVGDSSTYGAAWGQYRTDAAGLNNLVIHAGEHGITLLPGFNCFVTQSRAYGGL